MKKNLLIVGLIVFLILALDQILKIWVKSTFVIADGPMPFTKEPVNLIGSWFKLNYVENQGMAFGTTFGASIWAKLALSIFRIVAICGIAWYWLKQARLNMKREFLIALGLIFAGAMGNLIDSMFYDFVFSDSYYPCMDWNQLPGSGIKSDCGIFGQMETRHTGFLLGNVVDMFQFDMTWPSWVPWLGGGQVFPPIWNTADASITIGVLMILIRQRKYFPKKKKNEIIEESTQE